MDDCTYDKIKLLHKISQISGFIEKHCLTDARKAKHKECEKVIDHLHQDLLLHMEGLRQCLSDDACNVRKSPRKKR